MSDWGQHEAALQDLRQAKAIGKKLPGPLNGYVTSNLSEELSFMAQDKDEFQEVTDLACEAETFISQDDTLDDYTMHFNKVRYVLNLSSALVVSPNAQLHEPDEAIHLIEKEVPFFDDTRSAQYRQSHCNIVLARANMAKRDYAYATKLLADSVAIMQEVHSKLHLVEIERLYGELRQTSYKDSVEVARLNLALIQLKHPQLFNL